MHGWTQPAINTGRQDTAGYGLQYDSAGLKIPGKSFSIGIIPRNGNGPALRTKGLLNGTVAWSKYKLEVDSGSFSGGTVKLHKSAQYKKGDSITVSVYTRKWFLGGKGKFLFTQRVPYDYEDSIEVLTTGNIGRAPGDHVQFGVRTWYDNKQFADQWAPVKKNNLKGFLFDYDGGHLSKKKGDLKIENDPTRITGDRVRLIASLAKAPSIRDTLQIMLDYIADYKCKVQSATRGHDLAVTVDAYFDSLINATLLKVNVADSAGHKTYHYRINTKGGTLAISTRGANGMDGSNGADGSAGSNGSDGAISTDVTTNPDGTITTTTTQGPGGDGGRGGDGEDGRDGDDGSDGGNIAIAYTPAAAPFIHLLKPVSIPGNGGSGGRGGNGGSGGTGGSGNPSGSNGTSGIDGHSGRDGSNGRPGKVSFISTPPPAP
jgi:hypothetical protein